MKVVHAIIAFLSGLSFYERAARTGSSGGSPRPGPGIVYRLSLILAKLLLKRTVISASKKQRG